MNVGHSGVPAKGQIHCEYMTKSQLRDAIYSLLVVIYTDLTVV